MHRRHALMLIAASVVAGCAGSGDPAGSDTAPDVTSASGPDTTVTDTTVTDTTVADTTVADTTVADTTVADTTVADTTVADTTVPESSELDDVPARDFTVVDEIVTEFVDDRGLNGAGLIVVADGEGVVYEQYWGEFDAERVSLVASSSKQITAGVLLHLQDRGLLDMDAPVAEAVPWGAANPDITPAQLVSSRSGLVGLLQDPAYGPYVCQFLADGELEQCAETIFTTTDDDADQVAPDTEFRYGGGQWQVAGGIAEAVSGTPWAQLVDEIYVAPCGLDALGYTNHFVALGAGFDYPEVFDGDVDVLPVTENPSMEGGAYLTVPDYGKLLQMHLDGGRCGDVQVLSEAALDAMYADGLAAFDGQAGAGTGYGMGWFVDRATGRLTDPGAYGSVAWLDLEDGHGAYVVIEADSATGGELAGRLYDPVERAVAGG